MPEHNESSDQPPIERVVHERAYRLTDEQIDRLNQELRENTDPIDPEVAGAIRYYGATILGKLHEPYGANMSTRAKRLAADPNRGERFIPVSERQINNLVRPWQRDTPGSIHYTAATNRSAPRRCSYGRRARNFH